MFCFSRSAVSAASSIAEESIGTSSKSSKSSISEDIKTEIHTEKKYVMFSYTVYRLSYDVRGI